MSIQECMSAIMADVREVRKDQRNEQQHFTFRGVDAVVNAVGPALRKHDVVVLPHLDSIEYAPYSTSKGTGMMSARVLVTYRFVGPEGDYLEATVAGEASDAGDKATAKAMSVAFRTALLQALTLPTDDKDPDAETYERPAPTASAAPGESTVAEQGHVTRPAEPRDAQAALDAASPSQSAVPSGVTADQEAPAGGDDRALGEGAAPTPDPAGASTHFLGKDDQGLLASQYGSKVAALNAYKAKFGERIVRLGDITYEMRDQMDGANA